MTEDVRRAARIDRAAAAAGPGAVLSTLARVGAMGVARGVRALAHVNQVDGFDCPGCAWPEPTPRHALEFCENGAKAVAHEATPKRVGREFFARFGVAELAAQDDVWLEAQGRLVEPMWLAPGADQYAPISWDDAFARIGEHLRALASPDEAVFYTSGRTSNEAAFLWQLFARAFGTNNLPDCSNLCHESSGTGLTEAIGEGKGTVGLDDFALCDLILVLGQNPGSNHPRMLTYLQAAKRRGCKIVSINPLRERGLVAFANPQEALGLAGVGTPLADLFVQLRVGGDVALLQAVAKLVLELDDPSGKVLDREFIAAHTEGFEAWAAQLRARDLGALGAACGVPLATLRELAELYARSERVIACWAMGLTQHAHGVANVQEVMNLLLLRGNIGRPGAGPCPVRGHSNVQGDRTMGIWERPTEAFLARLDAEFGLRAPRAHGHDTVSAIRALAEGRARVFVALGGNFARATPDTDFTEQALRRAALTVQISTKLNRSHLVTGREALILPALGRTERDVHDGVARFVTVEDSMRCVHRSQGALEPASEQLESEPAIVCGIARAALGAAHPIPWEALAADYDLVRERIARVVPGCEDMNRRVREAGGFVLPSAAGARAFRTASGRAHFTLHDPPAHELPDGQLWLMTIRSHDQYNTTVYGNDDRYRGVYGDRRVLFLHADDLAALGFVEGERVRIRSHWRGETRELPGFALRAYDLPRGCAAAYFPEANALVPVGAVAAKSGTPAYKSVPVSLHRP